MTKNFFINILLTGVFLFISISASALDFGSMKKDAYGESSDVMRSFVNWAGSLDSNPASNNVPDEKTYADLIAKYQNASARDPFADLLALFPVANKKRVEELKALDSNLLLTLLSKNPSESDLAAILLARSPHLSAAENAWRATLNRYPQTLYLQDLMTRYQSFTENMNLGIGKEYQSDMIQMHSSNPGMLALQGSIAELDTEIAYSDFLREGVETISDFRNLLAEIRNKDELISVNRSSVSRLSVLSSVVEAQYKSGSKSFSDLIRIRTELASRNDMSNQMISMRGGFYAQLASMLDLEPNVKFGEILFADDASPELSLDGLGSEIPESRQELVMLALDVEKMDAMIAMSNLDADPDLTLGFTWYQGNEISGLSDNSSMAGNSSDMKMKSDSKADSGTADTGSSDFMNSPMIDNRQADYSQKHSWALELTDRRKAMSDMLSAKTNMALGMLGMLIEQYSQSLKSENVYSGKIVPEAQAALDAVRIGYSSGENDFSDLISSDLSLLAARTDLANLKLTSRSTLYEIERLVGHDLHK